MKNPKSYKTVIPRILGLSSYAELQNIPNQDIKYDVRTNSELLRWEVFAFSNDTVSFLFTTCGVVICIIIFTSVFCIRNSFAIAITEKMKMYGMLASIGATKKQIRRNVIFEGLILGAIAIPIGILSGIFAVFVLLKIVNSLIGEQLLTNVDGIIMKVTLSPIIISVILSILTIYLSSKNSAKKASKVDPIELLRNSEEINIKSKKLKVPKIISKIFKTGGELAYKNLKRSKKKYRTTVISLAVSIFIFITMNTLLTNMFDLTENYYQDYDYNVQIYAYNATDQDIDKIKGLNYIDEKFVVYENSSSFHIFDVDKVNEIPGQVILEDGGFYDDEGKHVDDGKGKRITMNIIGLDTETFNKYLENIGVNPKSIQEQAILSDKYLYYEENTSRQSEKRIYKYNKNDTITGEMDGQEIKFKIGAITDIKPYGFERTYRQGGDLIVNIDVYKDIEFEPRMVLVQSSNPDRFVEEVENLKISDIFCNNFDEIVRNEKSMSLTVKIFLYGFITVITLIGVTNIFNTITSNMELRQKEFASLKSIGMTKKEFNRMINLETCFYSAKSLIYGITLGLIGSFALYKSFSIKIEKGIYIPINPIIISIIAVFILVFVIMKYSMAKINKQNTIETIRNENI